MADKVRLTVGIAGLGLIGGSFARAYAAGGARVLGYDADAAVMREAEEAGAIAGELTNENAKECDLILVALYPAAAVEYLTKLPHISAAAAL